MTPLGHCSVASMRKDAESVQTDTVKRLNKIRVELKKRVFLLMLYDKNSFKFAVMVVDDNFIIL